MDKPTKDASASTAAPKHASAEAAVAPKTATTFLVQHRVKQEPEPVPMDDGARVSVKSSPLQKNATAKTTIVMASSMNHGATKENPAPLVSEPANEPENGDAKATKPVSNVPSNPVHPKQKHATTSMMTVMATSMKM